MSPLKRPRSGKERWGRLYPPPYQDAGCSVFWLWRTDGIVLEGYIGDSLYPDLVRRLERPSAGRSLSEGDEMAIESFIDRLRKITSDREVAPHGSDPWLSKRCPLLHELLFTTAISGKERKTATLSVTVYEGKVRVFVNDRDTGLSLAITLQSLQNAWESLEAALADPEAGWRRSSGQDSRTKGKRTP